MDFLPIRKDHVVDFVDSAGNLLACHHFEPRQLMAINAALSAGRPLLVRGEPGIGKSQLARAAAKALGRAFVQHVVDARTESRDLLWHFDAVARLAEAQMMGALQLACLPPKSADQTDGPQPAEQVLKELRDHLDIQKFIHPRALWWAFNWQSAADQSKAIRENLAGTGEDVKADQPPQPDGGDYSNGCVVLIDEIDKAESDVPNGLLEALGAGRFTPQGLNAPVESKGPPPLVIITTNEERTLPDAFVRRCLVLHLTLPKARDKLIKKLVGRGKNHFKGQTTDTVLKKAAELLATDRKTAEQRHWRPLPGQAEYLDLVRSVVRQSKGDRRLQNRLIGQVCEFVLKKHPEAAPLPDEGDE